MPREIREDWEEIVCSRCGETVITYQQGTEIISNTVPRNTTHPIEILEPVCKNCKYL